MSGSVMGYHRLGELRRLYPPRVANAVIAAFVMHGDAVNVVAETGEEVGPTSTNEGARMTPAMWTSAINLAEDYSARLETIEQVKSVRARIMRMAQHEKSLIKQGKSVIEQQQRELEEARKHRDAPLEGQLEWAMKENEKQIGELENSLVSRTAMIAQCDDVLNRL